jgi:hypothetical protein
MSEGANDPSPASVNLETFQEKVLACIPLLESPIPDLVRGQQLSGETRAMIEALLAKEFGPEKARSELAILAASGDMTSSTKAYLGRRIAEIESAKERGSEIASTSEFKRHACAALNSVSNDVFSIAKVLTPVLAGLVAAGTIVIPLNPLVFAAIALAVSRMGIAALCAEYKGKEKKEE